MLLVAEPEDRITVKQALNHRWFKNSLERKTVQVPKRLISKLLKKKASNLLAREAMKIIVKHLPSGSIAELNVRCNLELLQSARPSTQRVYYG